MTRDVKIRASLRCLRLRARWGRLSTCGRLPIGLRIFLADTQFIFRDRLSAPTAALSRRGRAPVRHLASARKPSVQPKISFGHYLRPALCWHGPASGYRVRWPAIPVHAGDCNDGHGCHSLPGSAAEALPAPCICCNAELRSSSDDAAGGGLQGDALAQEIHGAGG